MEKTETKHNSPTHVEKIDTNLLGETFEHNKALIVQKINELTSSSIVIIGCLEDLTVELANLKKDLAVKEASRKGRNKVILWIITIGVPGLFGGLITAYNIFIKGD